MQYVSFLKDLPFPGGRKSRHNDTGGTYDCIMLFAYYAVLDPKPSMEELYEMNMAVILPAFQRIADLLM